MALINIPSKITELTTIDPMVCKKSLAKFDIENIPILIPTEDSLKSFIDYEIDWALPSDIDLDSYDEWRKSILSLIVLVLQKNIIHLSDFYKSNDHQSEKELMQNV